jgi:hypothetical protein
VGGQQLTSSGQKNLHAFVHEIERDEKVGLKQANFDNGMHLKYLLVPNLSSSYDRRHPHHFLTMAMKTLRLPTIRCI